jgi:hypothetical protein
MTYSEFTSPVSRSASRPFVASYDLGYEYTQEHYIALQCMLEDADNESLQIEDLELEYAV